MSGDCLLSKLYLSGIEMYNRLKMLNGDESTPNCTLVELKFLTQWLI